MGRSTSCFKIIACGSDSAETDDLQVTENKGSSDNSRWSFRKRSARHRVLNNTVISEVPSTAKESIESANINLQASDASIVVEKISPIQCTGEQPLFSTSAESKTSEASRVVKDEGDVDAHLEESLVIVIQAAVRGFLAQRELFKLKNVVKLQAVARGHLVRQHAIGTLRCIHAIVKMQTLVRARRARLLLEDSCAGEKLDGKHEKTVSETLKKDSLATKPHVTYTSIEKLLSNSFARQLMTSTPKVRPIHIKCDPLRPNSAWNWLERWMAVSSAEPTPSPESTKQLEREKNEKFSSSAEIEATTGSFCETANMKSNAVESILPSEGEENLITVSTGKFEASHPDSSLVEPEPVTINASDVNKKSMDINSSSNKYVESDMNSPTVLVSLPCKLEIEREQPDQPKRTVKRFASEQMETERKKDNFVSEKISNPAFIASHSKFEELSSTANSNRSLDLSYHDGEFESNVDTVSSGVDVKTRGKELNIIENLGPPNTRGRYGGSECGTELSITSTLDSPYRSEIGGVEYDIEGEVSEGETSNPKTEKVASVEEGKNSSTEPISNIFSGQPQRGNDVKDVSEYSLVPAYCSQTELKLETSASDVKRPLHSETGGPVYRSSPEASPKSHITVPESQGTPSSQISGVAKKNSTEKSISNHKRKSILASKISPSNPNHDSAARSSVEQLPRDQKNGKRRNSFGSGRSAPADQELRDASSSHSLPHFMQATESARAKISATSSPRSSPDVQVRDYIKKRHSLPVANGRQGSPRVQRSISHAQQGAKGNGGHVVHEKKWQR